MTKKPAPQPKSQLETNPFTLSIAAIKQLFATNPSATIGAMILALLLAVFNDAAARATPDVNASSLLLRLGFVGLSAFVGLIGLQIALKSTRDQKVSFKETLNDALENFLPYLGYTICLVGIVSLGFLALIIPGIMFAIWYGLVLTIRIDNGSSKLKPVFQRSRKLIRGRELEFIAIQVCSVIFSGFTILGPAAQSSIITSWYRQLSAAHDSGKKLPPVSKQSKLVAIVSILLAVTLAMVVYAAYTLNK